MEFFIARNGDLTANGEFIGNFVSEDGALDFAIRHAQNNDSLYRVFYGSFA